MKKIKKIFRGLIYLIYDEDGLVYIGYSCRSEDIRFSEHFEDTEKIQDMKNPQIKVLEYVLGDKEYIEKVEKEFIKKYKNEYGDKL